MRTIAGLVAACACIACASCDTREPEIVDSRNSPDGAYVLWVMNDYGGLQSGVVYVHVTLRGETPTYRTEVLRRRSAPRPWQAGRVRIQS